MGWFEGETAFLLSCCYNGICIMAAGSIWPKPLPFNQRNLCVVGIRRNSTSMRGSRSHLCRLLSALRHLRTPILGCILVRKKNSHFASVFCLYLRRFRRGFGLFPSYMTLRSARVWFLVLFRHFKFSSKSLRLPYAAASRKAQNGHPAIFADFDQKIQK